MKDEIIALIISYALTLNSFITVHLNINKQNMLKINSLLKYSW